MRNPFRRQRSITDETKEQLQLAAAVAAESVLTEHIRYAMEVVHEGSDRAPVERLVAAYSRLHHLSEAEHRKLREGVFVALGRDPDTAGKGRLQQPRSILRRVGRRLRGRVHFELREWVQRHTARVELAVLNIHVEHALRFARIVQENQSPARAADLYSEVMGLRPSITEMVRLRVLAAAPSGVEADDPIVEPLRRPGSGGEMLPFRLAEEGG